MRYEEIQPFLESHANTSLLIDFKEYEYTPHNTKSIILEIENFSLITYIKPNEFMLREDVAMYYGKEIEEQSYENLCRYPYLRLVIAEPSNNITQQEYKVLHLNKTFFTSHLQEIHIKEQDIEHVGLGAIPWTGQF